MILAFRTVGIDNPSMSFHQMVHSTADSPGFYVRAVSESSPLGRSILAHPIGGRMARIIIDRQDGCFQTYVQEVHFILDEIYELPYCPVSVFLQLVSPT